LQWKKYGNTAPAEEERYMQNSKSSKMELKEASAFLSFENRNPLPQLWLDLGCGSGLFTQALTHYLPEGSRIIAVDRDKNALRQIPASANRVFIETKAADFIDEALDVKEADGVLMANSLHYVKDKEIFLNRLRGLLKPNAVFLLVEYDRQTANQWVPYPIHMEAAKALFKKLGFASFRLLNKRRSVYGGQSMYAAVLSP
jgi:SAM-dependent methyltransferase